MPRKFHLLAVGLVGAMTAFASQAEEVRRGQERFEVLLGAFLPAFNSDVRVDGETDQGDRVDLGDDLGVDEDETGYIVGVQWRFKEKHRLGFTYSDFTLNGTRVIDEEIQIRDQVYPVNATLRTEQKIEIIPITYSYSFINNEQHEFAATAGIHWTAVTLSLRGSTDDGSFEASSFFSIEFGESELDAKGSLANARIYGEYHFAGRYSAGLAVDAFKLSLEMDKTRWQGEYDYRYWGPQIFVTARF
jgi:hypothetical protein